MTPLDVATGEQALGAAFLRVQRAIQAVEGGYARVELPDAADEGCDWAKAEQVLRFLALMTAELERAAKAMRPDIETLRETVRAARLAITRLDAMAGIVAPVPAVHRRPIVVDWKEAP